MNAELFGSVLERLAEIDAKQDRIIELLTKPKRQSKPRSSKVEYPEWFEKVWKMYPARAGSNPKKRAYQCACARKKENWIHWSGTLWADHFEKGVRRYADYCDATGKTGTELVMQGQRFFGVNKEYQNDWTIPSENTNALPKRDEDLQGWAIKNGHPEPRAGESWYEYRKRLESLL